jgi:hypothetical protein
LYVFAQYGALWPGIEVVVVKTAVVVVEAGSIVVVVAGCMVVVVTYTTSHVPLPLLQGPIGLV